MTIYLKDKSGVGGATSNTERGAKALELVGFVRCTKAEYQAAIRASERGDGKAVAEKKAESHD